MEFIEIIKVTILGIVQGITEWLPISSTGHMILVDEFIKLNVTVEFKEMFLVVIQLASIMAVVVLYFHKLNPFSPKKTSQEKMDTISLWTKVIVGIIPAGIIGVLFDDWITAHFYNYLTVAVMLILYGVIFIIVENKNKNRPSKINNFSQLSYKTAFGIGIFQVLSLIPGNSSNLLRSSLRKLSKSCQYFSKLS